MRRRTRFLFIILGPVVIWVAIGILTATSIGVAVFTWRHSPLVQLPSLAGKVVVVDPGHGGEDPGAVGRLPEGVEKDITLKVSFYLRDLLRKAGAVVILTRDEDNALRNLPDHLNEHINTSFAPELRERVKLAKAAGADLVVSIHVNKFPSSVLRGSQVFYTRGSSPETRRLALALQQELVHLLGNTDREVSDDINHYMIKTMSVPAVTVEIGFISCPEEERLLVDPVYQKQLAWAMFVGISRFLAEGPLPAAGD